MNAPQVEPTTTDTGDDLVHAFCCNEDLGLCGADLSNSVEDAIAPDDELCPVCVIAAVNRTPCAVPGCPNWRDW